MKEIYIGQIPRRSFIQQFVTFLVPVENFAGNIDRWQWRSEISLQRNFRLYQAQNEQFRQWCEEQNIDRLIQELLQIYQQDLIAESQRELAKWHLAAYLEAPLYQAVQDRFKAFKDYQFPINTWEHYLHIAKCIAYEPEQVAHIYRRYAPGKYSLEQYFRLELASKIRDIFYQQTGQGKYSMWFALKRSSKSELKRGLLRTGVSDSYIPCYIAAKNSLFAVYSKSGKRWLEPTPVQYQQALDYLKHHYAASECSSLATNQEINKARFETLIAVCLRAIQTSVTIESLDADEDDYLPSYGQEDPLTRLENQQSSEDWQDQQQKIDAVLTNQIKQLDEIDQTILRLRSLGISQKQIAAQTLINQATVSRRYQRCQRYLLRSLTTLLQEEFLVSVATTEALEQVDQYITIWLQRQYANQPQTDSEKGGM